MKTLFAATKQLVRPHLEAIRQYQALYPKAPTPKARNTPRSVDIWKHYVSSMITSQQAISTEFWKRIRADRRWQELQSGGPENCPSERAIAALLRRQKVRFPGQKAMRIKRAQTRDFERLAALTRSILKESHDHRAGAAELRSKEVSLAAALQDELSGCGVAPKIARLTLHFTGEFEHVIPIDSRWKNALERVGAEVRQGDFARESTYLLIENELARAALDLGVPPLLADSAVFGWVQASLPEVTR